MDDGRIERRRNTDELATVRRLIPSPGPKSVGFLVWWVLGLYALFLAGAPYTPTVEEEQRYADLMTQAVFSEELRQAQHALMVEQRQLDEVNVWFWWTRSPYDRLVPEAAGGHFEAAPGTGRVFKKEKPDHRRSRGDRERDPASNDGKHRFRTIEDRLQHLGAEITETKHGSGIT